jgi:hypothetical protein
MASRVGRIQLQCIVCGKSFLRYASATGTKWYCSQECRIKDASAIARGVQPKPTVTHCKSCGAVVEYLQAHRPREYCSVNCRHRYTERHLDPERKKIRQAKSNLRAKGYRTRQMANEAEAIQQRMVGKFCEVCFQTCQQCGKLSCISVNAIGTRYCSSECWAESRRVEAQRRRQRTCKECGQQFIAPQGDKRRSFCSLKCSRKFGKRIRRMRERAQRHGCPAEYVDVWEIARRDGWKCGICGRRVDKNLAYPDPKSASLDHIIPLAGGGSHTCANAQLAHLRCNVVKSDSAGGQLRLAL